MRILAFLAVFCSVAVADCVITPGYPGSERNAFADGNLVVCDVTLQWRDPDQPLDESPHIFLDRGATLTWEPGIDGSLQIEGVGISFFDDTGAIRTTRYGGGFYDFSQDFGGIGNGYDIDFEPDPDAPLTIDGRSTSGLLQMYWSQSWNDESHTIWANSSTVGTKIIFGDAVVQTAVPEPSAFILLGSIGLFATGRAWWKSRNCLE